LHLVAVVVFFTTLAVELKPEELAELEQAMVAQLLLLQLPVFRLAQAAVVVETTLARLLVLQEKPVL
jgi:hypothetical protein